MSREVVCGIYKIELKDELKSEINGNGIYIGESGDIYKRWCDHKRSCKYDIKNSLDIVRAFKQFGLDNFNFNIIERCPFNKLSERELYWINFYNSYENGYNMTLRTNYPYSNGKFSASKLTKTNVNYIRKFYKKYYKKIPKSNFFDKMSYKYNITKTSISSIIHNRTWYDPKYNTEYLKNIPVLNGSVINRNTANRIREYYKNNNIPQCEVANIFGVSPDIVSNVVRNKSFYDKDYSIEFLNNRNIDISGDKNGMSKINWDDVNNIRNDFLDNSLNINKAVKEYNISRNMIELILKNKNWYDNKFEEFKLKENKHMKNENNPNSKMNWKLINHYRIAYNITKYSYRDLSKFYPVSRSMLYKINNNKIWYDEIFNKYIENDIGIGEFAKIKGFDLEKIKGELYDFYE